MSTMTAKVLISGFALTVSTVLAVGQQASPDKGRIEPGKRADLAVLSQDII